VTIDIKRNPVDLGGMRPSPGASFWASYALAVAVDAVRLLGRRWSTLAIVA
jgi:hypothetical protein